MREDDQYSPPEHGVLCPSYIKDLLNMRRFHVTSEKNLDGEIFVTFTILIGIAHLNHRIKGADLYKTYTISLILNKPAAPK